MRTFILIVIILISVNLQAQKSDNSIKPTKFEFGALAGMNSQKLKYVGNTLLVEARYNISPDLVLKFSVGRSLLSKESNAFVKTNGYGRIDGSYKFQTIEYYIQKYDYDIVPISIGMEYKFSGETYKPFGIFEAGYNSFRTFIVSSERYFPGGTFDFSDQVPEEYRGAAPAIFKGASFRFAFGLGLKHQTTSFFNLDIRYLYEINTSLVNNHVVMIGFNFKYL